MAEILEITKEDALKIKIIYKANLSFTQLNTYLQFMVINDLITHKTFEGRASTFSKCTVHYFNC